MPATPPLPSALGIAYGGDYNPEQWPREVWDEDVRLMREAGVNLVSVGIFSWALIETDEHVFDFAWLDELLDLLHANGIAVDLGTPTAAPPAWFWTKYPEARPLQRDGRLHGPGSRGMASHSSPAYREAIVRIASALADRYADHPAVVLWHVHNEYGVPVGEDFGPASIAAWREWLQERYGDLDGLNAAWGTAVWGQHYSAWEQIQAPIDTASVPNQSQSLDWARFTDHRIRECFILERDAIRARASQPITTNFMANQSWNTDLWAWAQEVDIVADDHYLVAADRDNHLGLAIAADLTRSVGGGKPWMLMEHSTGAVNWQERNVAKLPGELARNSMTHLARGADAVMFFQWRASRLGPEKFHSAMLPHAGTRSRVWREVVELGATLGSLAEVRGSEVVADVAVLWDWESMWAQELPWRPSIDLGFRQQVRDYYEQLWGDGITVDFALPGHDLSKYRLVVAPAQYLLSVADADNLTEYVARGGILVVGPFSAVVDEHDRVHEGGFAAPLETVLGLRVEEHLPLRLGDTSALAWEHDGAALELTADAWNEAIEAGTADVVAAYSSGPGVGGAAITRNVHGAGAAWYVSARLDGTGIRTVLRAALADAGLAPAGHPAGLEVVTRRGADADYVVAVNHADDEALLEVAGVELGSGTETDGALRIPGGTVAVVRTAQPAERGWSPILTTTARSGA
ncbi:beta-galactosidase [Agromyces seonyuensis]|uniref:beta-galactosidase n=1 Tax=Agromyces seonyuensis TaxID=2662446 RepID=UPI0030142987